MAVALAVSDDMKSLAERIGRLTPREKQCLRLVAVPMRTHEIAAELQLSPTTVDTYISSGFKKLGASDRNTAARLLVRHESLPEKTRYEFPGVDEAPRSSVIPVASPRFPFPWPSQGRPRNDLTILQLIVATAVATAILLGVATLYIAALVALGASV